jgi:uncharacterized membrane protein YciS (DUF1049 family)
MNTIRELNKKIFILNSLIVLMPISMIALVYASVLLFHKKLILCLGVIFIIGFVCSVIMFGAIKLKNQIKVLRDLINK